MTKTGCHILSYLISLVVLFKLYINLSVIGKRFVSNIMPESVKELRDNVIDPQLQIFYL